MQSLSGAKTMTLSIIGPERYDLAVRPDGYAVRCEMGFEKFSGLAARRIPKLYVISVDEWPVYVGITRTRLSARFRLGWRGNGRHGYHGYKWRDRITAAKVDIWGQEQPEPIPNEILDIEVIEAEVVFLIRQAGQWPEYQTEIHFHRSSEEHRHWAAEIMGRYRAR